MLEELRPSVYFSTLFSLSIDLLIKKISNEEY